MTSELFSILGIEGIAIFSLVLLVSLGLSGVRLSAAGLAGGVSSPQSDRGRLNLRHRLAVQKTVLKEATGVRLRATDVVKFAGSVFAQVRKEAAQESANQSRIRFRHAALEGVKIAPVAGQAKFVGESVPVDECCAGVSENEPQRMDADKQWMRVNRIVAEGLGKAKEIESLHEAAARQLDAVDYAYERMLVELKDVLPAVVEARTVCRTNRDNDYATAEQAEQAELAFLEAGLQPLENEKPDGQAERDMVDNAVTARCEDAAGSRAEVVAA